MAGSNTDYRAGSTDYPVAEDAGRGRCQVAESAATFVLLRPRSDAEADMLREIDAIQERLRAGLPGFTGK